MKDQQKELDLPTVLTGLQVQALIKFGQEHPNGSSSNEYISSFPELSGVIMFDASRHNLGSDAQALITALPKSTNMLILHKCGIKLEYFKATLQCISDRLININFLDLSDNINVDNDTNDIKLLEFPLMPTSLTQLDISNNNFGKHILSLAKSLPKSISIFSLNGNMINNAVEVFEIIASRLPHLKVLEANCLGAEVDTLGILKCIRKFVGLTHLEFM